MEYFCAEETRLHGLGGDEIQRHMGEPATLLQVASLSMALR
jgi:hypothetical protein